MASLLALIDFLAFSQSALAAPSRNLTTLRTQYAPSFVSEPDGRGTWSLLYSCTFTLALCLWTAFHPNVKRPDASEARKYRLRFTWLAVAILAPELGVLTAFKQYRQSKALAAELSQMRARARLKDSSTTSADTWDGIGQDSKQPRSFGKDDAESVPPSHVPFSHTYGFYVLMGGLAVNVGHLHDRLHRILLTPSGLIHLARKGIFFEVADPDIQDKSKANLLAKGFVLLQITWTLLQCLSRKGIELPLSVLEVHVLVHAGCALIMYVLWFNKPMDIDEPIDVSGQIPDEIIALMLVQNHCFGMRPNRDFEIPIEYRPVGLSGKKFGLWPSRRVSEAAYLMYSPRLPSNSSDLNTSSESDQEDVLAVDHLPGSAVSPVPSIESENLVTRSEYCSDRSSKLSSASDQVVHEAQANTNASNLSAMIPSYSLPTVAQPIIGGDRPPTSAIEALPLAASQQGLEHASRSYTLTRTAAEPGYTCSGFTCKPAAEVKTVATIHTGQFLENGIGPKAFLTGEWRGDIVPRKRGWGPFRRPDAIVQIPEDLRKRLPLDRIESSTIVYHFPLSVSLSEKDLRRWQLAGRALRTELTSAKQFDDDSPFLDVENSADTIRGAHFVTQARLVGWHGPVLEELYHATYGTATFSCRYIPLLQGVYHRILELEELKLGMTNAVMTLPGLLYGALHLTLWNYRFPTYAELLLWRMSSVTLLAVPALAAFILFILAVYRKRFQGKAPHGTSKANRDLEGAFAGATDRKQNGRKGRLASSIKREVILDSWLLASISLVMITAFYIFSRTFIIVESFISLRHVPIGVYTDVGWSKYIPHL
ncbi:MAG: hypothetical protein Q9166_001785 [cf. Caloplaca sp. 2 TL-2023]